MGHAYLLKLLGFSGWHDHVVVVVLGQLEDRGKLPLNFEKAFGLPIPPKKWWKQLCLSHGKKDHDWSHLARRYFPARVDEKCQKDPSLAVAHGCFWKDHPAKAYAWELRLKDEIRPDFTIDEPGSDEHRKRFLKDHAAEARALEAAEQKRRERKAAKAEADEPEEGGAGEADEDEP
jgi:hypothetical protein